MFFKCEVEWLVLVVVLRRVLASSTDEPRPTKSGLCCKDLVGSLLFWFYRNSIIVGPANRCNGVRRARQPSSFWRGA